MQLFLIRHAEAAPGAPDELRPLTPSGRANARRLGERLAREGVAFEAVLASPLLRARETAEAVARPAGLEPLVDERLAPGATVDGLREAVAGLAGPVAAIGHQPDCGRIAAVLTGGSEPPFPPGGLVVVEL